MSSRVLNSVLMLLILILGVMHILSFGFCLQDDTYIGLRYSRNLAEGNGPVFNEGEKVEGYTNFLWVVLGTVPFLIKIDPILYIRTIGIVSAILSALMIGKLAVVISGGRKYSGVIPAFIFVSLPFAMGEAAMGLETLLFSFFVVGAFCSYLVEMEDLTRKGITSGLFLALAYLTRPEGFAVGLFVLSIDLLRWKRISRSMALTAQLKTRWLFFGVIALIHESFRILYYGDFVPNTFHAKISVGGGDS